MDIIKTFGAITFACDETVARILLADTCSDATGLTETGVAARRD